MGTAFIWDLDGTLIDSYAVMVPSLCELCRIYGLPAEREAIHSAVIASSVRAFLQKTADGSGLSFEELKKRYDEISEQRNGEIRPIPQAKETLEALSAAGARHFVYTHRGGSAEEILARLGLHAFFEEIVTARSGFARKPAPDAIDDLVARHALDRGSTYYVGDRTLDMDCAKNAHIKGILYLPAGSYCRANGAEDHIVRSLPEIAALGLS